MNRLSQNPRVPATQQVGFFSYLVRVHYFFSASGCLSIPFHLQFMTTLVEGDQAQMWEFIRV